MKKLSAIIVAAACLLSFIGCTQTSKDQPLAYLVGAQEMIGRIAIEDLDKAWYLVYVDKADPELAKKFERYAEMFNGREVKRCDCYDYKRMGDRSVANEQYTETTYYKIYLTENDTGEPDYYVKVIGISDGNGDGIISLEIFEEAPNK